MIDIGVQALPPGQATQTEALAPGGGPGRAEEVGTGLFESVLRGMIEASPSGGGTGRFRTDAAATDGQDCPVTTGAPGEESAASEDSCCAADLAAALAAQAAAYPAPVIPAAPVPNAAGSRAGEPEVATVERVARTADGNRAAPAPVAFGLPVSTAPAAVTGGRSTIRGQRASAGMTEMTPDKDATSQVAGARSRGQTPAEHSAVEEFVNPAGASTRATAVGSESAPIGPSSATPAAPGLSATSTPGVSSVGTLALGEIGAVAAGASDATEPTAAPSKAPAVGDAEASQNRCDVARGMVDGARTPSVPAPARPEGTMHSSAASTAPTAGQTSPDAASDGRSPTRQDNDSRFVAVPEGHPGNPQATHAESDVPVASRGGASTVRTRAIDLIADQARRLEYPRNSRMHVQLRPEALGTVDLRLVLKDGVLGLEIQASTGHGRDLIESALPQLRHALGERGIDLGHLAVTSNGLSPDSGLNGGQKGAWTFAGWTGGNNSRRGAEGSAQPATGLYTERSGDRSRDVVSSDHLVDLRI